jgi:hypothetical protein
VKHNTSIDELGSVWIAPAGSPGSPPTPIDWRWVGDKAESMCSKVTTMGRLLLETQASVNRNILGLIWVHLKREEKTVSAPPASFMDSHPLLCFVSAAPVPGWHGRACIVGGGDLNTRGNHYCGSWPCHGGTWCKDLLKRLLQCEIAPPFMSKIKKTGPPWRRGRHRRGYREWR